ncbi:hypothetical protein [Streptomyces sp. NPDC051677]|uniref:hypothetical protein n=1 Tax=Streptomyces sp. NPDC051677 TaxID=3365669 RepID=UPI0037D513A7
MPDDSRRAPGSTQRVAYDTLSEGFGPSFSGPLTVVVNAGDSDDPKAAAEQATSLLGKLGDIASVRGTAFNHIGDVSLIGVIPASAPTSQATKDLVTGIRGQSAALHKETGAEQPSASSLTGGSVLSPRLTRELIDAVREQDSAHSLKRKRRLSHLTGREREVLTALASG